MPIAYQEQQWSDLKIPYRPESESLAGAVGTQLNEYMELVWRQLYVEYWPIGLSKTVRPIGTVLRSDIAAALLEIDATIDALAAPSRSDGVGIEALADGALSALKTRHESGLTDEWSDAL